NGYMPKDCSDSCIRNKTSGLHTVYPDGITKVAVQCEKEGLTVIQKRYDGNKNIAQLTSEGNYELRIDVEDWDGNKRYAVYGRFSIGDASTKYQLNISGYSGNAEDKQWVSQVDRNSLAVQPMSTRVPFSLLLVFIV
ncbi:Hypothetical predicted protein, partial [Mytilus galloprovincialis]